MRASREGRAERLTKRAAKADRLRAELADARAADALTPDLFADPSKGDIKPNPDRPLSRADEAALSALADYYDEEARP